MSVSINGAGSITGIDQGFNVTAGSVGIGTDVVGDKLVIHQGSDDDVIVRVNGADSSSEFAAMGVGSGYAAFVAGGTGTTNTDMVLMTSPSGVETERLRIKSDGKIGVGVASPQQKLDVVGLAHTVALFRPDNASVSAYGDASVVNNLINLRMPYGSNPGSANNNGARWGIKFQGRNDGAEYGTDTSKSASIYAVSEDATAGYNRQVGLAFYTSGFDANQTERMRIMSDGNVAIGHNSAPTKLGIRGTSASTDATVQIVGNNVSTLLLGQDAAGGVIRGQGGSNQLKFKVGGSGDDAAATGGVEALRIDSTGRLLVGGSTSARSNFFNGSSWIPQVQIENTSDQKSSLSLICSHATNNQAGLLALGATKSSSLGGNGLTGSSQGLGIITFQGNDGSQMVEAARIACVAAGSPSADNMPGELRFSVNSGSSGATERLRITSDGAIAVGNASQMGSNYARISIDCQGRDVLTDVTDVKKYGLAFHNDPNTNDANGIGFFNDDGTSCGGYILHQDKGSNNLGDLIFATSATSNNPIERLRIKSNGHVHIGNPTELAYVATTTHTFALSGNSDNTFSCPGSVAISGATAYNTANYAGGGIRFLGKYRSSGEYTTFAHVGGIKENTIDNNYAGALTFHTRNHGGLGAERMRISSNGQVTMPVQPCFFATSNTGGSNTSTGYSGIFSNQLEAAYVNIGNHFNTSNGIFTCPVAGTYEFHGQGLIRWQGSVGRAELSFYKNGANTISRSYGYTYVTGASDHDNLHVMAYITCAANDQIDLRVYAMDSGVDCYFAQGLGYFAGRLVQ